MPRSRPKPAPPAAPKPVPGIDLWISLGLLAAVFAVYLQAGQFQFLRYDDPEFVVNNLNIRRGLTPASVAWAFQTGYAANWLPLTWLSYMLGFDIYGLSSAWHHLTNVFLHALNSVLLFWLLRRITAARWPSAFAAALFAVHPLHVEAVAWVSERREVLSGLFWLLTLAAYASFVHRPRPAVYILTLLAFVGGLMAKPMIVTLPFVLLLLDYWPLRRWSSVPIRRLVIEKVPLAVLAGIVSVITWMVQQRAGAISSLTEVAFGLRAENALVAYTAYFRQFLWPSRLAVLYPYAIDLPVWKAISAAVLLAAVTIIATRVRRRWPFLFVGWLWFLGTLVPVIGFVQVGVQSRADRYMYVPLIGLALAAAWSLNAIVGRHRNLRTAVAALASFGCCLYAITAAVTASYWRDTATLFRHAVAVTDNNWAALNVLGGALLAEHRADEAIPYIRQTLDLRPNLPEAHINLGAAFSQRGEFEAAAEQYRMALQADPGNTDAQEGLGVVLTERGQFDQARSHLEAAAAVATASADAHYNLGRLYGLSGHPELAAPEFATTIALQPENAEAHFNLGAAYAAQEQFAQAEAQFREAIRLKPDYTAARFNLGAALANLGRLDDAIGQFREVLQAHPDFPGAGEALQNCLDLKAQSGH